MADKNQNTTVRFGVVEIAKAREAAEGVYEKKRAEAKKAAEVTTDAPKTETANSK